MEKRNLWPSTSRTKIRVRRTSGRGVQIGESFQNVRPKERPRRIFLESPKKIEEGMYIRRRRYLYIRRVRSQLILSRHPSSLFARMTPHSQLERQYAFAGLTHALHMSSEKNWRICFKRTITLLSRSRRSFLKLWASIQPGLL
jgi:hypothetical protein